jgi:hypothetical protein
LGSNASIVVTLRRDDEALKRKHHLEIILTAEREEYTRKRNRRLPSPQRPQE